MNSGAVINLDCLNHSCRNIEQILFSESCGRILFSINPENEKIINDFFEKSNFKSWSMIGEVNNDQIFSINYNEHSTLYSATDMNNSYKTNYFKI